MLGIMDSNYGIEGRFEDGGKEQKKLLKGVLKDNIVCMKKKFIVNYWVQIR